MVNKATSIRPRHVNCIGIDDMPFDRNHQGQVGIVGAVFAGLRLDGMVIGAVEKDGTDAARRIVELIGTSKFYQHCNLIMLQGICLAGFNVVDAMEIHIALKRPVLVVSRRPPDYEAMKRALVEKIPNGKAKWKIIESLGPMEPCENCFIQRVGLEREEAENIVRFFCANGNIPEPLRVAHIVAGAIGRGCSRGRV
ncbi:MAG: DUF99 family protein [Thermodesulfobacteria bacterium]|nr:DUF99 family protein [Thermodesulfobacteriota bacterium]